MPIWGSISRCERDPCPICDWKSRTSKYLLRSFCVYVFLIGLRSFKLSTTSICTLTFLWIFSCVCSPTPVTQRAWNSSTALWVNRNASCFAFAEHLIRGLDKKHLEQFLSVVVIFVRYLWQWTKCLLKRLHGYGRLHSPTTPITTVVLPAWFFTCKYWHHAQRVTERLSLRMSKGLRLLSNHELIWESHEKSSRHLSSRPQWSTLIGFAWIFRFVLVMMHRKPD